MRTDRELLTDALAAFEEIRMIEVRDYLDLIEEIRARLADFKLEPRAWVASKSDDGKKDALYWNSRDAEEGGYALIEPLYSHPRQPVRLTDDEVKQVIRQTIPDVTVSESVTFRAIARAIEKAIWEKK